MTRILVSILASPVGERRKRDQDLLPLKTHCHPQLRDGLI